jgi:hypothetical protein
MEGTEDGSFAQFGATEESLVKGIAELTTKKSRLTTKWNGNVTSTEAGLNVPRRARLELHQQILSRGIHKCKENLHRIRGYGARWLMHA